jgi:uncharacterized circularly permuted ATP-grasp superfamily protein
VAEAHALREAFTAGGITYAGEPMRSFLRPQLVEARDWDALRQSARRLLEIASRLARQVFEGDVRRLAEFLGLPEQEWAWLAIDPGLPDVALSRLDALLTPAGPRFLEINSDAPAGFGYGDRMAEVFATFQSFWRFRERVPVRYQPSCPALVEAIRQAWRSSGGTGEPRVAIVDWREVKTRPDQEILREELEHAGLVCLLADPRDLELRAGRLRAPGGPVDVVYRRVVLSEALARAADVRSFLEAYRVGAAVFVNSFRCRLSEDKAFFAILTDEAHAALLTPDEQELVARCVPWTRRVEERRTERRGETFDLVPWVIAERERLVLKPAHGYGGQSVLLGDETEERVWARAVDEALRGAWVVQERIAIPEEEFPVVESGGLTFEALKINTNPFYVAGAEVGAVTRVSRASVINVGAGGGSVPTFVVG